MPGSGWPLPRAMPSLEKELWSLFISGPRLILDVSRRAGMVEPRRCILRQCRRRSRFQYATFFVCFWFIHLVRPKQDTVESQFHSSQHCSRTFNANTSSVHRREMRYSSSFQTGRWRTFYTAHTAISQVSIFRSRFMLNTAEISRTPHSSR